MVDKKYTADIQAIAKRIKLLVQRDDLSRTAILETLGRQTCFSGRSLVSRKVEERYKTSLVPRFYRLAFQQLSIDFGTMSIARGNGYSLLPTLV